jgi:serine/threonine-protein kinase
MIGTIIGNYEIISKLAEGGMGAVYRGRHINLPREVVIKCILLSGFSQGTHDLLKARFLREARLQSQLDHPNIVRVYEFFLAEENYYLVMEYVAGMSLADLLKQRGRLTESQALELFGQALAGMDYAHHFSWQDETRNSQAGIVHRDIKPGNMLVDGIARLKITDFGIARVESENSLTQSGFNPGTVAYMSPEQLNGLRLDLRSDIYSLGVTFYEMLAGRLPFVSSNPGSDYEIRKGHIELEPLPLMQFAPEISPELNEIVMRSLRKKPEERFQSAGEFLEALQMYRQQFLEQRKEEPSMDTIRQTVLAATSLKVPAQTVSRVASETARTSSPAVSAAAGKAASSITSGTQATRPRVPQGAPGSPLHLSIPLEKTSFRRDESATPARGSKKILATVAIVGLLLIVAAIPFVRSRQGATPVAGNAPAPAVTLPQTENPVATPSATATPATTETVSAAAKTIPASEAAPSPAASPAVSGNLPTDNAAANAELDQAREHESQERYREAISTYENYLRTYPNAANAGVITSHLGQLKQFYGLLTTAKQELAQYDHEGAERDFKQALSLRPDSRQASSGYEEARIQVRRAKERAAEEAAEAARRQQRSVGEPGTPVIQLPPMPLPGGPPPGGMRIPPPPGPRRP